MAQADAEMLEELLDAFNRHDVDAIMEFFTEDCVFETPRGPDPWGRRLTGKAEVRTGFEARFAGIPDIHYGDERHWVSGDRGVSEWTISGTDVSGAKVKVKGCDLLELREGEDRPQGLLLEDRGGLALGALGALAGQPGDRLAAGAEAGAHQPGNLPKRI
jgi:ketosteroid isomerase-like protein